MIDRRQKLGAVIRVTADDSTGTSPFCIKGSLRGDQQNPQVGLPVFFLFWMLQFDVVVVSRGNRWGISATT